MTATASIDASRMALALRAAAWWLAVVTLGMVALAAFDALFLLIDPLWSGSTRPWGRAGLAVAAAWILFTTASTWTAWRLAGSALRRPALVPIAIVGLSIAVRVGVAIVFDGPIYGENRAIHNQALGVLDGSCCFSHRPMGYPVALAGAYAVLGVGPAAVESLNLAFAAVTTWLVWAIGRAGWDARVGAVAGTLFALAPSQVLMVLAPLTEPMFTLIVAGVVRLALELERPGVAASVAVGALLAVGQYVRATAVSMLAPLFGLLIMTHARASEWARRAALMAAAFGLLMLPVVGYNLERHDALSVSTSAYAGWSMYVGANRDSDGQWNAADAARFAEFPGTSAWDKSEHAGTLVGERIAEDPDGALRLIPRKFLVMWADERYAAAYALASGPPTRDVHVGWLVSQLFYAPLTLLAVVGMVADRVTRRPAVLLIGMMATLVAFSHLALEVHSRYHAYLLPLLCVLAAAGIGALARMPRVRPER